MRSQAPTAERAAAQFLLTECKEYARVSRITGRSQAQIEDGLLAFSRHGMWTLLKYTALVLKCIVLGFGWLLVSIPVLIVSIPVLIVGLVYGIEAYQNATYARSAFGPTRGIERVVASKRWHGQIFGCTYAVVELTPARSAALVAGYKFRELFGKQAMYWDHPPNWQATPRDLHLQNDCYLEGVPFADKQAILNGLNEPGGWAGEFYEYRAFFLPKRNLIGIIRNGD